MKNPEYDEEARVERDHRTALDAYRDRVLRGPLRAQVKTLAYEDKDSRVLTAMDAIVDRELWLLSVAGSDAWVIGPDGGTAFMNDQPRDEEGLMSARRAIAFFLANATPYVWDESIVEAVLSIDPPAVHPVAAEDMPERHMWWRFSPVYTFNVKSQSADGSLADECLFHCVGFVVSTLEEAGCVHINAIGNVEFKNRTGVPAVAICRTIQFGEEWPMHSLGSVFWSLLAFLNSPYIPKESRECPRQARRLAEREGRPLPSTRATFVTLRRRERRHGDGEGRGKVEHDHRWLVSGHWRRQWYATTRTHRTIWIAPFAKGPEDKPLVVRPRAARVAR